MSDSSEGPGWWIASDGKWYPPEQAPWNRAPNPAGAPPVAGPGQPPVPITAPGTFVPLPGPPVGTPPYGPPPGVAGGPDPAPPPLPPLGAPTAPPPGPPTGPPPGYTYGYQAPPPGYGYGYGYGPIQRTNGLAVASLVCSFLFWLWGLGAILAIVFGFIARSQIKRSGGTQKGAGLALAGIIIGISALVLAAVVIIVVVALVHHCDQTGHCTLTTNPGTTQ